MLISTYVMFALIEHFKMVDTIAVPLSEHDRNQQNNHHGSSFETCSRDLEEEDLEVEEKLGSRNTLHGA